MPLYLSHVSTCDVCHEKYDADLTTRWPRSLPCGHIFCNLCTDQLWINRNVGKSPCPHCRKESYFWETANRLYVQYPGGAVGQSSDGHTAASAAERSNSENFVVDWEYLSIEFLIVAAWVLSLFTLLPDVVNEWAN